MIPKVARVRVVHLVPALNVGGLEKVVLDLVRYTNRSRFGACVICLNESGTLAPSFKNVGVAVESLNCAGRGKWRTLWRLISRLRQIRPHVLHTHNPTPHILGALASLVADIPALVHTKHGRNYPDRFRSVMMNRLASKFTY